MDMNKIAIAQPTDLTNTDAIPSPTDVRSEVRSLEEMELVFVGGGESIPNW